MGLHCLKAVEVIVISEELERIGVDIEGVGLGIIDTHGAVGSFGIAQRIAVKQVVTPQFVAVIAVDIDDIAEAFGEGAVGLVVEGVGLDTDALITDDGTIQEVDALSTGVVAAVLAVDVIVAIIYIRGPHNTRPPCFGVVVKGVGDKGALGRAHIHIIIEHRLVGGRAVLSPLALKGVVAVHQAAAIEEVAELVEAVVV